MILSESKPTCKHSNTPVVAIVSASENMPTVRHPDVEYVATNETITKSYLGRLVDDRRLIILPVVKDGNEFKADQEETNKERIVAYAIMNRRSAVEKFGVSRLTKECKAGAIKYLEDIVEQSYIV